MSDSEHQLHVQSAPVRSGLLADKVAIITGASRGIGAATARVFAQAGATVVLAARDAQALEAGPRHLRDLPARSFALPTGLRDPAPVHRPGGQHLLTRGRPRATL